MILASKIGIAGQDIYYYSKITGTRFLTYSEFSGLDSLDTARSPATGRDPAVLRPAQSSRASGIAFFMADRSFGKDDFAGCDFGQMNDEWLRDVYQRLRHKFQAAVAAYWGDDLNWRNGAAACSPR